MTMSGRKRIRKNIICDVAMCRAGAHPNKRECPYVGFFSEGPQLVLKQALLASMLAWKCRFWG